MKKNMFFVVMMVGMSVFCGCKKDIVPVTTMAAPVSKTKIEQLKDWYEVQRKQRNLQNKDAFSLPDQNPVWDSTLYFANGNIYAAPLEKKDDAYGKIARSLVLHVDGNGNVVSGEFTFIRLTNSPGNLSLDEVLNSYPKVFEFTDMPDNFEASMLKYDLQGNKIYSKHYVNNTITDTDEKIKSIERAPANIPDGSGTEVCIDSWWIVYVNGEVYSIEYLGSVCFTTGNPNTPGGAGAPTTGIDWQAVWDALLSHRHAISEPISVMLMQLNSTYREQKYYWYIFDVWYAGSHVKFASTETGSQVKVNGVWQWSSLHHNAITKNNVNPIPSINWDAVCQLIVPNAVINNPMFSTWASMQIFYNIKLTLSAATFNENESHDYDSICTWNQSQTTNSL